MAHFVRRTLGRLAAALLVSAPGLVMAALYARRLALVRDDPTISPGTPEETWLALGAALIVGLSARFAASAGAGHMSATRSAGAFIALFAAASALVLQII